MLRVDVRPELLRWARERSRRDESFLARAFPKLAEWESRRVRPTLRQLEEYARATYTPIGFFFLSVPPDDRLPIPDFRTVGSRKLPHPSPNLLDTIFACERRQAWYRSFATLAREERRSFVGSVRSTQSPEQVARAMRTELDFDVARRNDMETWDEALRSLIDHVDDAGVLVMCSGVVGNNTSRPLDVEEFRGFTLVDDLAPLIFVNARDSRSAQMFTLGHELAHVWLGAGGVSNATASDAEGSEIERWCNAVAAELLAPLEMVRASIRPEESLDRTAQRIARTFKVSTLVALRRMLDAGRIDRATFRAEYDREATRLRNRSKTSGGNFHATQAVRVGRRFAHALVVDTFEGNTLERDALRLLDISKPSTLQRFAENLGLVG